jgi:hypothetical protein
MRRRHMSWLATRPRIGIGQRLVIQDAVAWLVFEAFVERLLCLACGPVEHDPRHLQAV